MRIVSGTALATGSGRQRRLAPRRSLIATARFRLDNALVGCERRAWSHHETLQLDPGWSVIFFRKVEKRCDMRPHCLDKNP